VTLSALLLILHRRRLHVTQHYVSRNVDSKDCKGLETVTQQRDFITPTQVFHQYMNSYIIIINVFTN